MVVLLHTEPVVQYLCPDTVFTYLKIGSMRRTQSNSIGFLKASMTRDLYNRFLTIQSFFKNSVKYGLEAHIVSENKKKERKMKWVRS